MGKVYICAVKVLGFPFVVETEAQAKEWVSKDPELNYYDAVRFEPAPKEARP